jgi:hypothetical protein
MESIAILLREKRVYVFDIRSLDTECLFQAMASSLAPIYPFASGPPFSSRRIVGQFIPVAIPQGTARVLELAGDDTQCSFLPMRESGLG